MNLLDQAGMTGSCEGLATSPTGAKLAVWARDRKPRRFSGLRGAVNRPTPYLMMMRSYSAVLGRFVSRDRLAGTVLQPSSLNRYTYVDANPVAFADPLGLSPLRPIIDTPYFALGGATSGHKKQDKDNQKAENKVKAFAALNSPFTTVDPNLLPGIETAIYFDPKFAANMAEMGAQLDAGHLLSFESKDVAALVSAGTVSVSNKEDPNTVSGVSYVAPNSSGGVTIHIVVNSNPSAGVSGPTLIAAAVSHEVYHAVRMVRRSWKNPASASERQSEEQGAHTAAYGTAWSIFRATGTGYDDVPDGPMKTTLLSHSQ